MSERLDAGTIVDGRYRIEHRLGAGGMADVYCAEDLQLGRKVALKLLYRRFAEDTEFVERFRREASSAAGLQHPHVVSVYDRGEYDGTSYIAMEFVDGRTLKQVVQQEGPLDPARAIDLTEQVLRATRFAHKRGVIHRDLKPHNVIVDAEGRAKVTDFGIARAGASDMTQTGSIMGTAQYLSPEQAQGQPVSAASDLYSVGIVLYELLTGRVPFEGDSAVAIALKQVNELPVPPSQHNPAVPPALEAVVMRALEKDPAQRFTDASAFIDALEQARRVLSHGAENADPTHPTAVAGAAAALGGAGAGAAFGAALTPDPPTQVSGPAPAVPSHEGYGYPSEPLPPDAGSRGDGRKWWIAVLVGLGVAALIVGGLLLFGGKKVTVPSVIGAPQAEAEVALRNRGFATDTVGKTDPRLRGTVIGQSPNPGTRAKKGTTVTLTVSEGPGQATIPSVAGKGRRTARKLLGQAGFTKLKEETRNDATVPKNRVIGTSPAEGQRLEKDEEITLFISTGPEQVLVPGVVGKAQEEARTTLEDAGFTVSIKEQESPDKDPGTVLAQSPAADATAGKGSKVVLTVAKEPAKATVPDVTGKSLEEAASALQDAGFKFKTTDQPVDTLDQDGIVLGQDPPSGKDVKRGATVTLTVGKFDPALNPEPGTTTTPGGTDGTTTTP